ncbi:MAG TPA: hypothetical protein ENJ27_00845 [Candidatus Moranbacteria bacterium]|nr:hypothetical protein [Candidatus Moranbacteria bacterium]
MQNCKIKFLLFLIFLPFLSLSQNSKYNPSYCIEITGYISENVDSLSADSLLIFFKQFSIKTNENNVEFSEWGNEILFKVMKNRPELFFNTLFHMSKEEQKSIEDEINSPINDGINMIKFHKELENCKLDQKTKQRALIFIDKSYKAFKKMIEEWEKKYNKKWEY